MNTHVTRTISRCFGSLRQLRTIRRSVPGLTFQSLVVSLVLSRLDYGNATLVGLPAFQYRRLQSVMNAGARLIFDAASREHVTPLLHQLHWLRAEQRVTYKIETLTYQCLHGSAPRYLADSLQLISNLPSRTRLRSSSSTSLLVPRTHLKSVGDRAFSAAASKILNDLPSAITSATSLTAFKKSLKTHLFRISFPSA